MIVVFGSCNKSNPTGPNQSSAYLNGTVVDSQGNPIDSVNFHYIPTLVHLSLQKSGPDRICPATMIKYSIPRNSFVNLSIYRWFTRDLIATLVNENQNAGTYAVTLDASSVTNGVYIFRLAVDSLVTEHNMLLIQDTTTLTSTIPLATTNSSGQFSEPIGVFGIGLPFYISSSSGPTVIDTEYISSTIQVVLCKAGYKTLVQSVTIDTTKSLSQRFTLEK